jgi:hypothetical protein
METRLRLTLAFVGVVVFLVCPLAAQQRAPGVRTGPPVLQTGDVPIGSLGYCLGSYLTVEGVMNRELKTGPLRVDRINGQRLRVAVDITVANLVLPDGVRCVLKGYETATMIGQPPAVAAAAKEAGREPTAGPQAAWQVHMEFVALSVVAPQNLKIKERP